jgi:hypothetical protein
MVDFGGGKKLSKSDNFIHPLITSGIGFFLARQYMIT